MVNLDLYKVFYTVAKCGSLTKAAEELYVTQPAISQAIKQLEHQLGIRLFTRMHKGVELTVQGGELVFPEVEHALHILMGVEDKLSELRESATGTLRIGASETIFQYCLADKIVKFHEMYPQVKLELIAGFTYKTIENLKIDRCDVGFLNLPIDPDEGILLTDTVMLLNDIFLAGPAFFNLKRKKLSIWELQEYPLILMQERMVARESFDRYCQSVGVRLSPAIEVDSWGFMKRLIEDGMGIGCIPREYAKHMIEEGKAIELNVSPALPTRSVGMATAKTSGASFALRTFLSLMRKK